MESFQVNSPMKNPRNSTNLFLQDDFCDNCKQIITESISPSSSVVSTPERELHQNFPTIADRLRQVEIELAEKKLALTQALCENQELIHQLRHPSAIPNDTSDTNSISSIRSNSTNSTVSWLSKTVNTIKEAASSSTNRAKVN